MARDVASVVRQYESAPAQEPMHGRPGETRRNPSTDDKRIRREQIRSHAELEEPPMSITAAIATLLGQASVADTDAERQSLLGQVEALRTQQADQHEAEFGWDPRLAVMGPGPVPGAVYERNTADSDWLLTVEASADLKSISNEMLVQASRWYERVSPEVKAYGGEFEEQARNMARRLAGRYGEHADYADEKFRTEASRLRAQAVRAGLIKNAIEELVDDTFGKMKDGSDVDGLAEASQGVANGLYDHTGSLRATGGLDTNTALWDAFDEPIQTEAASGVPQVGEQGLPQAEFSNLAGESALPPGATDSNRSPVLQEMQSYPGWSGTSVVPPDDGHAETANAGDIGPQDAARPQPGFPVGAAKTTRQQDPHDETYWDDGTMIDRGRCDTCGAPCDDKGCTKNRNHDIAKESSMTHRQDDDEVYDGNGRFNPRGRCDTCGAPCDDKGCTKNRNHDIAKESSMTQAHAATCPTCGGQGKVAARVLDPRQAYSGLPQIDQIMNNSDTAPEQTEYPAEVAFPWQMNSNTVPSAISETEQQIAQRNQRSQLAPQAAQQHRANGRDNSGWMGDNGARGTDYPGYSTPNYGGPDNLGQPDPVYNQGGDNPNRPLLPYGNAETSDVTNQPDEWAYGEPAQADQAWRTVAPGGGMNVQGASQQEKIAAVQARIARDQQLLAAVYEGRA